jgi:hypothetical protein
VERWLAIELGAAIVGTAFLAFLGWLMQGRKTGGLVLVGMTAAMSSGVCILGTFVGRYVGENAGGWLGNALAGERGGWVGLVAGMLLSAVLIVPRLAGFARARSVWPFVVSWLGLCVLCIAGYLLGDWPGLAMVPLTTIVILLWLLFRFSKWVLPLPEVIKHEVSFFERIRAFFRDPRSGVQSLYKASIQAYRRVLAFLRHPQKNGYHPRPEQANAFRCLLTFLLGSNWPFYFVQNGKVEKRVDGNPFRQFFAGPGFVYCEPDQAAYVTDGVRLTRVCGPGLTFTGLYDQEVVPLDLRRQLRAFYVEALTKDGIRIRVLVFTPFRLYSSEKDAKLPGSFPFSPRTAQQIAQHEFTERMREKTAGSERHTWNGTLVLVLTKPIVQDIISRYTVDELCSPLDPDKDPRVDIVREMRRRLRRVLASYGIELIGGGISNLVPLDDKVNQRRLDNWKTEWEHRVLLAMGEGRSERARHIEKARAQAELQILHRLGQAARDGDLGDEASQVALTLRFIDCLGEVMSEADAQWPLPESCRETLARLRGEIEEGLR